LTTRSSESGVENTRPPGSVSSSEQTQHLSEFSDQQIAAALVTAGAAIYARITEDGSS
jgi:hypothetical protein